MFTFSQYTSLSSYTYIIEQWLSIQNNITEATDNIVYRKGKQYISLSDHGDERLARKWWTDFDDSDFTKFADKSLDVLHKWYVNAKIDSFDGKLKFKSLIFQPKSEVAFVVRDLSKKDSDPFKWKRGIIGSLRESDNKAMDSYHIMTVLNMDSDLMNKSRPLISKNDVPVEIIGYKTKAEHIENEENNKKRLAEIDDKIDEIQLQIWDLEESGEKPKELKSLKNTINNLKMEKSNLTKTNESVILKHKITGNELVIVVI